VLLRDELEIKLGLDPDHRTALYNLVGSYSNQHLRVKMTSEQKQLIKEHVEKSPHANNVPLLCDELLLTFSKVPRNTLYKTIQGVLISQSAKEITDEIKEIVRQHIANSPHPDKVVLLRDEIVAKHEGKEQNRTALYYLVREYSHQHFDAQLSEAKKLELKEKVERLMDSSVSSLQMKERIEELCTKYHHEWGFPKKYLVKYAKDHVLKLNRPKKQKCRMPKRCER